MAKGMSDYLQNQKAVLKELVAQLASHFDFVSLLGTDVSGKQYRVKKNTVEISDSPWVERGFVVRVYQAGIYAEYSFNRLDAEKLPALTAQIIELLEAPLHRLQASGVPQVHYPLIHEAPLIRNFYREVAQKTGVHTPAEKLARLQRIKEFALQQSALLVDFKVQYDEVCVSKIYLSAERELEQAYVWSQGYLVPLVRAGNKTKTLFQALSGLKGSELLAEMADEDFIIQAIRRAERLLTASTVEPGEYDVICTPEIAGLIAHEAFGHGVEMDLFVKNRAKAQQYLGKRVASDLVTMHDGAASATQVSSYGFDDEGVLAGDTVVIDQGFLKTGIADQLSALRLGIEPTGNGKRESFERKVYTRMTNTFFAAGQDTLAEMIASVKHGYLLDGVMSGMEDPKNWGIQCLIRQGEEIRDGKLTGKIVSPVVLTGYVPDVLEAVSMVSPDLELFGSGACGKGYKEFVKVSDGGPYLKTRVRLG